MTGSTPSTPASAAGPTSAFRHWLKGLDDAELATILRHRPDTAQPLPPGTDALATRLLLRRSVARALAECDAAELLVIEKLAVQGAELEPVESAAEDAAGIAKLRRKALVFPVGKKVQLVAEALPALPTGWTLLDQVSASPADLAELDDAQRHILDTLQRAGGTGTTRDAGPDADPARPIPRLLVAGLLQRVDSETVCLPRVVRAALRGEAAHAIPTTPSGRAGEPATDKQADEAGTAAGLEVVRLLGELIDHVGAEPIEVLKDKSVGVRPVGQIAKLLAVDHLTAARLIDLGFTAGLLGRGEPKGYEGNFLGPTTRGLDWQEMDLSARWAALVDAWLHSPWAAWSSQRAIDPETNRPRLSDYRDRILNIYRHSATALSFKEFLEDLRFTHPLFAASTASETIENLHAEAQWLGLVARGRATSVLLEPNENTPTAEATAQLTPATVDQFIIQADMTVLAPGPLEPEVRRRLATIADLESPGLAAVYRLTEQSLRRGLDSGATAAELSAFLSEHALGSVPQTVTYLLEDLARRYGTLRAGTAMCYVRCEDPALLADATRAVSELRSLAPTVAVSSLRLDKILTKLRQHGFSPAAEDESGASIDVRPEPATVPLPSPRARQTGQPDIDKALRSIRDHDAAHPEAGAPVQAAPPLDVLRAAARGGRPVDITYAQKNGTLKTITATPLSVTGGQADVLTDGRTVRFPLHRISEVSLS